MEDGMVVNPLGNLKAKKIIFADFAVGRYETLIRWLKKDGIHCEVFTDPSKFMSRMMEDPFDICVVNLLVGGIGPFQLIHTLRESSCHPDIKIIVVSKQVHKLNIQNTIQAGANDFVAEPFENENMYHRILYHLTPKTVVDLTRYEQPVAGEKNREYIKLLLDATELLSRTPRGQEHVTFLKILQDIALLLGSNRTSLIIVDEKSHSGLVLATSDNPNFHDFPIALSKYPEILHVMNTGNIVLVEDVSQNLLTKRISETVREIVIGSLMVYPVRFQGDIVGVLQIRRSKATELPSMEILRGIQAIANILAAQSNIRALLRRIYKDYALKIG